MIDPDWLQRFLRAAERTFIYGIAALVLIFGILMALVALLALLK